MQTVSPEASQVTHPAIVNADSALNNVVGSSITLENGRVIDESSTHAPLWALVRGKNPRTYFDEQKMQELIDTVRPHGIIQPIIVRKNELGLLEIVAGERRYRAAKTVFGEDYEMPIKYFESITEEEAEAFSVIENHTRDGVAPTEEATNAGKLLARFKGDYQATAKYLGWDMKTLTNRLALLQLSPIVATALNERKIEVGVAELLATITRDRQETALEGILANNFSIAQIKKFIQDKSKLMASAIFDKTECGTCHYNTDLQTTMFAENLGCGSCSNDACYDAKTAAELESRRKTLEDEFPVAKIITVAEKFSIVRIVAEGTKNVVGPEQAVACKSCANYGGVVSAMPDSLGNVFRGQCFDVKCNQEKVIAFAEASLPAPAAKPTSAASNSNKGAQSSSSTTPEKKATTATAPKVPVTVVVETQRVKDYRQKIWRAAVKKEVAELPQKSLSLLFGLAAKSIISNVSAEKIQNAFSILSKQKMSATSSLSEFAATSDSFNQETRDKLLNGMTLSAVESVEVKDLVEMCVYIDLDLRKHWTINEEFFKLLTKSEIEVIAHEIGLKAHLDKAFSGLMNKSKEDFIKALLTSGFSFDGIIPKVMQYKS